MTDKQRKKGQADRVGRMTAGQARSRKLDIPDSAHVGKPLGRDGRPEATGPTDGLTEGAKQDRPEEVVHPAAQRLDEVYEAREAKEDDE